MPEYAAELIGQRRRWLNGSFAASVVRRTWFRLLSTNSITLVCSRSLFQTLQIWTRSDTHVFFPYPRLGTTNLLLKLLPITISQYNVVSLVFSWFALANIWLTFSIIIDLLPSQNIHIFGTNYIVSLHTGICQSYSRKSRLLGSTWRFNGYTLLFSGCSLSLPWEIDQREKERLMQSHCGKILLLLCGSTMTCVIRQGLCVFGCLSSGLFFLVDCHSVLREHSLFSFSMFDADIWLNI